MGVNTGYNGAHLRTSLEPHGSRFQTDSLGDKGRIVLGFQGGLILARLGVVHVGPVPSFEYPPNKIQGSIHALNTVKPVRVYQGEDFISMFQFQGLVNLL